jgi:hypothetical protein
LEGERIVLAAHKDNNSCITHSLSTIPPTNPKIIIPKYPHHWDIII